MRAKLTYLIIFLAFVIVALSRADVWPVGGGNSSLFGIPGSSGAGSGDVVGPDSSVDGEIVLFDSTTGKLVKRATGSGVCKATSGVASFAALLNADVSASAAIAYSKMEALTASRVMVTDGSGVASASSVTSTTLGYLDATSSVQTQLNAKQASGSYITALTGDVTASGPGSSAATIAANVVSNSKLATVATATFKGRTTSGTGNVEDLTATQATALLNSVVGDSGSGGTKGLVPAPSAGDAAAGKFLKADGTWAVASGGGVDTIGTFSGSSQTNGASISGTTITFGPADGTNPGMLSTGAQTIAGSKQFSSPVLAPDGTSSLPSYAFTNDPDTGIYSLNANIIGFVTGGAARYAIGNLGGGWYGFQRGTGSFGVVDNVDGYDAPHLWIYGNAFPRESNAYILGDEHYSGASHFRPWKAAVTNRIYMGYADGDADPAAATGTIKVKTGADLTLDADSVKSPSGFTVNTTASQPTCDSSIRGKIWVVQGGAGVADSAQICLKNAADAYAWVAFAP